MTGAAVVKVTQAYQFALDPTPAQERHLRSHCGAARVAFNWGLARVKAVMDQRSAERTYGIAEAEMTPPVPWSLYSMRKEWNRVKGQVAPWWAECSKEAYNTGLDSLARALDNWLGSRTGRRKGRSMGFPRFKSRHRSRLSCKFWTGSIRCERLHAVLPRLGRVKLHEDASALAGKVAAGTARILQATVRYERGRWFVSYTVEVERPARVPARPDATVGVDLGIKSLAVLSTGELVPNPRYLNKSLRKVRRLSRAVSRRIGPYDSAIRSRRTPSNRYRRAVAALGKAKSRVTNQRRDSLHKLTTRLATSYGTIVVEDLHVAGMLRNRRLARHVADAAFGEIRRQLEYKAEWNGGRVIVADRWFASSKTCSGCGAVKTKLALSERTYVCTACGLVMDRDVNAARNLAALVEECGGAGSGSEPVSGRGADCKTSLAGRVAVKRQPSIAAACQAGTDLPQGGSAGSHRVRTGV